MSPRSRYRVMHKFWLDITKNDEDCLDEQIHELKRKRKFATTIRDALRLILDLQAGRLDVLFELFPWVKAEFLAGMQPQETAGEKALKEQLQRLEKLMLQQGNTPVEMPASTGGPKALNVSRFNPPDFDDDSVDDIILKKDTSTSAGKNFLKSMMSLQT